MLRLHTVDQAVDWLRSRLSVGTLRTDSRQVKPGDGFVAWPGAAVDGRNFVHGALAAGAACCLVEAEGIAPANFQDERIACFAGLKAATGPIAAAYFGHARDGLDILAVTGTNGKTSTAWWLAQAISALRKAQHADRYACGLIGTLGMGTPGNLISTGLTTPDPVQLHAQLARLHAAGASACAMEASSIGLAEHRMDGTRISVAILTNFTQDHLDYHGTMQAYWLAKRMLFELPSVCVAVVNMDDPKGEELIAFCQQRGIKIVSTSLKRSEATIVGGQLVYHDAGMSFTVRAAGQTAQIDCPVVGEYNAANMLSVIGGLCALGADLPSAAAAVKACTPVPGRMDMVSQPGQPLLVVDYAHTPDALGKALAALRPTVSKRGGKLWCVFGCGGNRDPHKRPMMAQAVQAQAEQIVLTSDNPRDEPPAAIIDQVRAGFTNALRAQQCLTVMPNRQEAIQWATLQAAAQDVILIAGKGHETHQEIAGIKYPFSDREQANLALRQRLHGVAR